MDARSVGWLVVSLIAGLVGAALGFIAVQQQRRASQGRRDPDS